MGRRPGGSNGRKWSKATAPEVVIYSAGDRFGHPSCFATNALDDNLVSVPRHNAICGISNSEFRPYWTREAEYMTRVNGTITGGPPTARRPLMLTCEIGPGCRTPIPF